MTKGGKTARRAPSGKQKSAAGRPGVKANEMASLLAAATDPQPPADANFNDRHWLHVYKASTLRTQRTIADLAEAAAKMIEAEAAGQKSGEEQQAQAVHGLLEKRLDAKIKNREERTTGKEARANKRLDQEIKESELVSLDNSKERHLLRWLTALSFISTVVFSGLTARYVQPWGYAGVSTSLFLFAGGLVRLRVLTPLSGAKKKKKRKDRKGRGGKARKH